MPTEESDRLKDKLQKLKTEHKNLQRRAGRQALARAAAVAGAGAITVSAATTTAAGQAGRIPASGSLEKARGDRVRLVPRNSALDNPDDGDVTYRSDL